MKKLIVLLIAITLFILPVSAADTVFIGDYGVGFARDRDYNINLTTGTVIRSYPYSSSSDRSPYFYFQFDWKPNYTYRVICSFNFTQSATYFRHNFDIFKSSGFNITSEYDKYYTVSWNDVEILRNNDDPSTPNITYSWPTYSNGYLEVELIFDNDIVGLETLDYMVLRSIYSLTASADVYQMNYEVEAFEDPNNDIYNELILNQLNTISGQLNDILNAGSDHSSSIPSNGPELESTVGNLDRAEQNLYDRSDELLSSVQPQLNNYIIQASSSAESLLPVAGFVTNVFTKTKEALPPYVVVLFTVIPLLLFVGWLIGRFK